VDQFGGTVRRLFFAISFTLIVGLCHSASAQDVAGVEQGLKPYGSYHGGEIDNVSMSNFNPGIHIPLISYPQRGGKLNVGFELIFSNPSLVPHAQCYNFKPYTCYEADYTWYYSYFGAAGYVLNDAPAFIVPTFGRYVGCLSFNQGYPTCPPYQIVEPDGAVHQLGQLASGKMISMDATGYLWDPTARILTDRQGVRYTISTGTYGGSATAIEDTNGNDVTSNSGGWTDTLGRSIPSTTSSTTDYTGCTGPYPTTSAVLWTPPGPYGGTSPFKICNAFTPGWTFYPPGCDPPVCKGAGAGAGQLQSIVRYNGTSWTTSPAWTFEYDRGSNGTGFISKITFPTGGSISYTWAEFTFCGGAPVHSWYPYNFGVTSRTVDANDGTGPHTWNYAHNPSDYTQTIVTSPLGDDAVHTMTPLVTAACSSYENRLDEYHGSHSSGTLLRTTITDYNFTPNPYLANGPKTVINVAPSHITTKYFTGANTQTKRIEKDYDTGVAMSNGGAGTNAIYGNVIAQREYDYGSTSWGALLRQTKTNYQAFSGPNAASYLANNLISLPYSVQTLDGSGSQVAYTQYGYDESSLGSSGVGSSEQHDIAPPAGSYRGNQTSILRWLNSGTMTCQNGHSAGSGSNVTSVLTYFDTGTLQTSADPCGNTTTYAYSSTFWGAFPTTVTNALSEPTTNNFDFNTGLLASTKDPNNLTTSFTYDSMWRLATATHPDSEVDTITHQESSYPFSSTLTKTINASQNVVTKNIFDGLGRTTQTQLTSDPQGIVYTDTSYDALGRVATVSNPYRSGTDVTTTTGTTTFGYDSLSRKTSETYPDSSVLTTAYCGASTLVTDPTGRWRRSRVDGPGRLVEVDEPNAVGASVASTGCPGTGEPIWITSYTNDTLNNLTQIIQNGSHTRAFTYDSFSRMLTSNNPEVGTLTYSYNPDGVVLTKKDARNITSSYTFDALHREKTVTYSNGDPGISTNYDEATCLTGVPQCNNIGHRTSMTDAAGSEIWAYDVPDRIHKEQRTTSGITKSTTYNLDYAGNVTSVVYPTGRTVNYTFDSANRPGSAADGSNGILYAAGFDVSPGSTCTVDVACYTPQGTFYALSIGETSSFTGLNLTHSYNNRLQPQEFKASSTGGNAIDITYSFVDSVSGKNAGHVYGITNNLDTSRSQTFTYDQLNRITSALTTSTHATSPTHCWGETYTADAWGNLQSIAATTNSNYTGCTQESGFSSSADGNNHLAAFSYDLSGNTQNDGTFAYNWNAESQLKSAGGVTYAYDGDGRRVAKVGSKLYWYGSGGEILGETDASGNTTAEYIFFAGQRIAQVPATGTPIYYVEDLLGTSRVITTNIGVVCYDADFYPYGGERTVTNTCPQNYKFEGKERDTETSIGPGNTNGNDDFGARYYSNRFGRWLSADWSNVPVPVPYASLTNPQTLNLYSMVADDPESFADLDGHDKVCWGEKNNSSQCQTDAKAEAQDRNAANQKPQNQAQTETQTQTQTQPKQLSADDVAKGIQSAKADTGSNAKKSVDFLNSFGTNWNLSGDALRQGLKDSKVDAHGVDKKVDSVSRTGDTVTVQLNKGINFLIYKTKTTITFDVGTKSGRPALVNIQGVEVFHGYHYVPKTDYGPD
jgi:RHS repeat-associated protein